MQLRKYSQFGTFLITLLAMAPLWATNGYFTHGIGTKNKAMAGAGIAIPEDPIAIANNPAAALKTTGKWNAGLAIFSPHRRYESTASQLNGQFGAFTIGPNKINSGNRFFYIPNFAASWKINDDSAFAFALYGRGGMNTTFKGGTATFDPDGPGPAGPMTLPGTFGGGNENIDLSQAFLDLTYAHSAGDNFTWGAALVLAYQSFGARGLGTFAPFTKTFAASGGTAFPAKLTNNHHDKSYGAGGRFGIQYDMSNQFSLAVAYQTKIYMSKLSDYADLFAQRGKFDIPANFKAGLTYRPNPGLALSFDVEHTWFSDVDSVGNRFSNLFSCATVGGTSLDTCLGGQQGTGFGWDDMTTYKVGVRWNASKDWTLRAGFSHGDQPIAKSEVLFNITAPGVINDHATFGFTRNMASGSELSAAFMWAFDNTVSGPNPFDPTQKIYLKMYEYEFEVNYTWPFK